MLCVCVRMYDEQDKKNRAGQWQYTTSDYKNYIHIICDTTMNGQMAKPPSSTGSPRFFKKNIYINGNLTYHFEMSTNNNNPCIDDANYMLMSYSIVLIKSLIETRAEISNRLTDSNLLISFSFDPWFRLNRTTLHSNPPNSIITSQKLWINRH